MMKLKESEYRLIYPFGSWSATSQPDTVQDEQFESVLYLAENWDYDGEPVDWADGEAVVLSFDEIKAWFDGWDQIGQLTENLGTYDESEIYRTVHDWLRDTCYHFFHPVELVTKGGLNHETF